MVSTAAGIIKQNSIANGSVDLDCVNIVCITDAGKKIHFGQARAQSGQKNQFVRLETFELFRVSILIVHWDIPIYLSGPNRPVLR